MSTIEPLLAEIESVSRLVADPLSQLDFRPIATNDVEEYLARLTFHVAPSYLPFATDSSGIFCLHFWPTRDALDSPVVIVPTGEQEARFVCSSLRTLPAAVWLWVSEYYADSAGVLRAAVDDLAARIPGATPVPDRLWGYMDAGAVRWDSGDERINEAWAIAGVGHPFAGMPIQEYSTPPAKALQALQPFVESRRGEPEVVATLLATQAEAGTPRAARDVLFVLGAESWRNLTCLRGRWRARGTGICEWDATLKNIADPEATLSGTAFEPLIGHPTTYSGEDKEGPARLLAVADRFREAADRDAVLRQLRNSAMLSVLTDGEYPLDLAERIAGTCDAIAPASIAAAIARESARVHGQGP